MNINKSILMFLFPKTSNDKVFLIKKYIDNLKLSENILIAAINFYVKIFKIRNPKKNLIYFIGCLSLSQKFFNDDINYSCYGRRFDIYSIEKKVLKMLDYNLVVQKDIVMGYKNLFKQL